MIKREKYLKKIRPFIDTPLIKVITGIRRSGKSVLMLQIQDELIDAGVNPIQIISINKELHEFDHIKDYNDLYLYVTTKSKNKKSSRYYIFIDEVQEIIQWEKSVISFSAEKRYDLYITGSNARLLSSELASLLSGRYVEFQIHTLSFSEFITLYKQRHNIKTENTSEVFNEFIKYGGFPGLHSLYWEESVIRQYLQSVFNTIVLKDIIIRNQVRDASMLQRILFFLTDNCGNITTAKNISDYLKSQHYKIAPETVQNYIYYATESFMLIQAKRYDIKGKRLLELYEKYYLSDLGLLYALSGFEPSKISVRLENVIMHEMLTRGYSVTIGKSGQLEIDFICKKDNEKIYLQVCKSLLEGNAYEREYRAFDGINDSFPKYVLTLDNGFDTDKNGIKWMNIHKYLLDLE